ncbi:Ig-like domain-containing protein [Vibrio metoecus]|uniref:Ig-like domain-containing protein n=1 Tax=Vibrio metoecus TaxID=1481663 RepID=UPI00215BF1B2|nr:Ig-like domain-containing protein [Vibrio metoecus]MCR9388683.1 Ig-like domain-containing protein [Vibrio metoecus]
MAVILTACHDPNTLNSSINDSVKNVQVSIDESELVNGKSDPSIVVGQRLKVNIVTSFFDGSSMTLKDLSKIKTPEKENLEWISSDNSIASFVEPSVLLAHKEGEVVLQASYHGMLSNKLKIKVINPKVIELRITPASIDLPKGLTKDMSAIATYDDKSSRDVTNEVLWTSSDNNIVSVNDSGILKADSVGSSQLVASFSGLESNEVSINVTPAELTQIQVTPSTNSLAKGLNQQLNAIAIFTDATTQDVTSTVSWTSTDPNIATVQPSGLLVSVSKGSVDVIASLSSVTSNVAKVAITDALVTGLQITPATVSLAQGFTQPLTAIATYSDATTGDVSSVVSWSSDNTSVAIVDSDGVLKAQSVGSASVSASIDGVVSNTSTITVTAAVVTALQITPGTVSLPLGLTRQLTAIATYSDATTSDVTATVSWSSADISVAVVDLSGMLSTGSIGTSNITAHLDGVDSNVIPVQITDSVVTAVQITPASILLPKGSTQQLNAIATYSDLTTQDVTSTVSWVSGDTNVTTISSLGLLSAENVGMTTVTASVDGVTSNTASVEVTNANITSIQITPAAISLAKGTTQSLTAIATFSDLTTLDVTSTVSWLSSDTNLATILPSGVLSAEGIGNVTVSASMNGVTSNVSTVTVTDAVITAIQITPITVSLAKGTTESLVAVATYSDLTTQDVTSLVAWSSSNTTIATVSTSGLLTAEGVGVTNINASLDGVTSSTTNVTVTDAVITAILVSPSPLSLAKGTTQSLTAEAYYSDTTIQDVTASVSWMSNDTSIATVTAIGLLTAENVGAAEVTAVFSGITSNTLAVTVTNAIITSIQVTPSTASMAKGTNEPLTATATYSDSTVQDVTTSVSWLSNDTSIATITNLGSLTAVEVGNTEIIASLDGVSSNSVSVTVGNAVLVQLNVTPLSIVLDVAKTNQLTATGVFTDGTTQNLTSTVAWNIADLSMATVTTGGLMTGVRAGNTEISATLDGITSNITPIEIVSVGIVGKGTGLNIGSAGYQCLTDGRAGTSYDSSCLTYSLGAANFGWVPNSTFLTMEVTSSLPVKKVRFLGYYRQQAANSLGFWDVYGCDNATCTSKTLLVSPTDGWEFTTWVSFPNNTVAYPYYQFVFVSGPTNRNGGSGTANFSEIEYGF